MKNLLLMLSALCLLLVAVPAAQAQLIGDPFGWQGGPYNYGYVPGYGYVPANAVYRYPSCCPPRQIVNVYPRTCDCPKPVIRSGPTTETVETWDVKVHIRYPDGTTSNYDKQYTVNRKTTTTIVSPARVCYSAYVSDVPCALPPRHCIPPDVRDRVYVTASNVCFFDCTCGCQGYHYWKNREWVYCCGHD